MDGIIVINKPAGYTSHDCISIMRGITGQRKIGHTGTLDPNATGVLPVCFGKATKLIEYMDNVSKTYVAGFKLGYTTDTQDIWGKKIEKEYAPIPEDETIVIEALASFTGEIDQIPPAYSAVFVNGRRAYDIARSGQEPDLRPRKVVINSIDLLEYDASSAEGRFEICCGRGTYVRTVCHDLGEKLGCGGCLSSLIRTEACGFSISEALDLEEARKMPAEEVFERMIPVEYAVKGLPRLDLSETDYVKYMNGMTIKLDPAGYPQDTPIAVFSGNVLIGISQFRKDSLKPIKVFS